MFFVQLDISSSLPDSSISQFVHSFWMLENNAGKDVLSTVLPNGMVDLTFTKIGSSKWEVRLRGVDTTPTEITIVAGVKIFTIGLKLLAVEYLLGHPIKQISNEGVVVSNEFWQFEERHFESFENFCGHATQKIKKISTEKIDNRKRELFELIYSSHGSISIKKLSEKTHWSSRQINRYFNQQFGLSPKTYCNVLRLGASFKHISDGKLFPEENFADQTHFIKEIKKYAGVTPKELSKNKDNRFIDITAIKKFPR